MDFEVPGARLHVLDEGTGRPVLLVHGFPFSSAMWAPVATRLAARGLRAIAPDLRGFGASRGAPATSLATHAADLVALLDALRLPALPWVGFSMGGYVAFEAWRTHPRRITALGLVDTRAAPDDAAAREGRRTTADRVEREGSGVVADAMGKKLFAAGTPDALRRETGERMRAAVPAAVAAALRAMGDRADSRPTLPTISVPTLAIVGMEDAITPPADAREIAERVPGARLRVVEGAGHASPLERPDEVAAALAEFLLALPPPTSA